MNLLCTRLIVSSSIHTKKILPTLLYYLLTVSVVSHSKKKTFQIETQKIVFSPILMLTEYRIDKDIYGKDVPVCITPVATVPADTYFMMTISVFFLLPLIILICLYAIIARNLIRSDTKMKIRLSKPELGVKARKQVILMLGAVVLSFFICLLPFRLLTMWIILVPDETYKRLSFNTYYALLYFCRIMWYLNSAVNPILYNLMSSKFRKGFFKLCCFVRGRGTRKLPLIPRTGTQTTSSYLANSSSHRRRSSSAKISTSLDDLRIHHQHNHHHRHNNNNDDVILSSPTSGGGSSSAGQDETSELILFNLQSPLLLPTYNHQHHTNNKSLDDPDKLRRLAARNNCRNVSFDDSVLYGRTHRQQNYYCKQISFDESMCSIKYIDESSSNPNSEPSIVPLLKKL